MRRGRRRSDAPLPHRPHVRHALATPDEGRGQLFFSSSASMRGGLRGVRGGTPRHRGSPHPVAVAPAANGARHAALDRLRRPGHRMRVPPRPPAANRGARRHNIHIAASLLNCASRPQRGAAGLWSSSRPTRLAAPNGSCRGRAWGVPGVPVPHAPAASRRTPLALRNAPRPRLRGAAVPPSPDSSWAHRWREGPRERGAGTAG